MLHFTIAKIPGGASHNQCYYCGQTSMSHCLLCEFSAHFCFISSIISLSGVKNVALYIISVITAVEGQGIFSVNFYTFYFPFVAIM